MAEALHTAFPTRLSRIGDRISRVRPLERPGHVLTDFSERRQRRQLSRKARPNLHPEGEAYRRELEQAFGNVEFFLGVTSVHGVEPQQIAVNVDRKSTRLNSSHRL